MPVDIVSMHCRARIDIPSLTFESSARAPYVHSERSELWRAITGQDGHITSQSDFIGNLAPGILSQPDRLSICEGQQCQTRQNPEV